jgi:hypothetical protein
MAVLKPASKTKSSTDPMSLAIFRFSKMIENSWAPWSDLMRELLLLPAMNLLSFASNEYKYKN